MTPLICICCGREHDRRGESVCLMCAVLLYEAENDIASGRVQDASDAFAELDAEMRQEDST